MPPINIGIFFFHLVLHVPIYLVSVHLAIVFTIGISPFYLTILPWFITISISSFYLTALSWFPPSSPAFDIHNCLPPQLCPGS